MAANTASHSSRRAVRAHGPVLFLAALAVALAGCGGQAGTPLALQPAGASRPTAGPLTRGPADTRYFREAATGRAVLLTGSHTWNTFQDWGTSDPPPAFDYPGYLRFLSAHGHDFLRLYVWEQAAWFPGTEAKVVISPLPYLRTGPGLALDGHPRFDLTKFNPAYFRRLHDRVAAARARGIYVSVMLFDGWSIDLKGQKVGNPWRGHPFNRNNNINGIDGDVNADGQGSEVHTLVQPAVTALQKAYLAKVVVTLGDLDNVLWEVSDESRPESAGWEYEMVRSIHGLEIASGTPHPVGMTAAWPDDRRGNAVLFNSSAEWVSPHDNALDRYEQDPPPSTARPKIVLTDTDHLWGIGGSPAWVWKSFFRGLNPIFMDPYDTGIRNLLPWWPSGAARAGLAPPTETRKWETVRQAMGYARALSRRVDLGSLRPLGALASSGYCLASPGREYVAYMPSPPGRLRRMLDSMLGSGFHEHVVLDLSAALGSMHAEWVDPTRGLVLPSDPVRGGGSRLLRAPFAGDAIVHVWRTSVPAAHPALAGVAGHV